MSCHVVRLALISAQRTPERIGFPFSFKTTSSKQLRNAQTLCSKCPQALRIGVSNASSMATCTCSLLPHCLSWHAGGRIAYPVPAVLPTCQHLKPQEKSTGCRPLPSQVPVCSCCRPCTSATVETALVTIRWLGEAWLTCLVCSVCAGHMCFRLQRTRAYHHHEAALAHCLPQCLQVTPACGRAPGR